MRPPVWEAVLVYGGLAVAWCVSVWMIWPMLVEAFGGAR